MDLGGFPGRQEKDTRRNLLTLSSERTENSLRFLADAPLIPAQVDHLILADGIQIPLNG